MSPNSAEKPKWPMKPNRITMRSTQVNGPARNEFAWYAPDNHPVASLHCIVQSRPWVSLYDEAGRVSIGEGESPRAAYQAACVKQRLRQHDVAALLRRLAETERKLDDAERRTAQVTETVAQQTAHVEALETELKRTQQELEQVRHGSLVRQISRLEAENDHLRRIEGLPTRAELVVRGDDTYRHPRPLTLEEKQALFADFIRRGLLPDTYELSSAAPAQEVAGT